MHLSGVCKFVAWRALDLGERAHAATEGRRSSVTQGQAGHRGGSIPPPRTPQMASSIDCIPRLRTTREHEPAAP